MNHPELHELHELVDVPRECLEVEYHGVVEPRRQGSAGRAR